MFRLAADGNPVGASLLAKAKDQPPDVQADLSPSRAGSLPQGICSVFEIPTGKKTPRSSRGVSLAALRLAFYSIRKGRLLR
ncbi:hypothetical protein DMX04_10775 [Pseudomonas koreensis]|nr:hypothetical protein DMX04_10775 [Pseudomonas koreensis]